MQKKTVRVAIRKSLEKTHTDSEVKKILARTQVLYNTFIEEDLSNYPE